MALFIFQVCLHFSLSCLVINQRTENLAPTATMLNANQLTQAYAAALACPMTNSTSVGTTLLAQANTTQPPISLPALQQHHSHATATSPYIFLSASPTTSDEVCASAGNVTDVASGIITGKTTTLSSPSTLYFYNNNSTPTMYPTDFLCL